MPGLFDTLGVTSQALFTQQRGTQVTSNNIANVSTPGYRRQELILAENNSPNVGVHVVDVRRSIDHYLGRRILLENAKTSYAQTKADTLEHLENTVATLGDNSLQSSLNAFFSSWRELTARPQDTALRTTVLSKSQALADRIHVAADDLTVLQNNLDSEVSAQVDEVNTLLDEVAGLNTQILQIETETNQEASALHDKRDLALEKLSELIGATSFDPGDGSRTVLIGEGLTVVQAGHVQRIATSPDPTTGLNQITFDGKTINYRLHNGKIGALLELRDQEITTRMGTLDNFAFDLQTAVNGVHRVHFDLAGVTGRDFFAPIGAVSGAATSLTLDAGVKNNPNAIATAQLLATVPGDNRGAEAMVQLENQLVAGGGQQTLSQVLSGLVSGVGESRRQSLANVDFQEERLGALEALREGQSGVSLEEQMLQLSRYQRAFQAASRIVTTVDEMLEDLIRM